MDKLYFPLPQKGASFYDNKRMYATLAFEPILEGHTIVSFNNYRDIRDLNDLSLPEYLAFMRLIYAVRNALKEVYETDKVYMAYLDESCHVHMHLFPRKRGGETGFSIMQPAGGKLKDISKVPLLREKTKEYLLKEVKNEIS